MMALFEGYHGAYGTHGREVPNPEKHGKMEIKASAVTVREPVTAELWAAHLAGEHPIGIIPIRRDNTCVWGCIDVDKYDLSLQEVVLRLKKDGLPLVVCRTKSGGAHIFLFLSEPAPAADLQAKLRELAALLGHGGSEIFPKQVQVLSEKGDMGNWLNMPYFGGDASNRHGVRENGRGMTLGEFLRYAEERRVTPAQMMALRSAAQADDVFADGPPCLQHLAASGFPEGTRNNGLFALGTFLRKKFPDKWAPMLEEMNAQYLDPPLPAQEVVQVITSLKKKTYNYKCSDQPIASHCNAGLCRMRRHGVGAGSSMPTISNLSVLDTDQPVWFLDVGDRRLELTTSELQNPAAFQLRCMESAHVVVPILKRDTWQNILFGLYENLVKIEAPEEVGIIGQFGELLEAFATDRQRARERDEILLGKPWWDEAEARIYFRIRDLGDYLDKAKFKAMTRTQMTNRIREMGGGSHFFNIKGRGCNVWWVPSGEMHVQTAPHDIPNIREAVL